jgi:electron transport complex protein RnfA
VALLNVDQKYNLFKSLLYGFGSALGFTIVLLIFAGLRERIALARVPLAFAGHRSRLSPSVCSRWPSWASRA